MFRFLAALVLLTCAASLARAESDDGLDQLFADLLVAETEARARSIENDIWTAWVYAGDINTDELMDRGIYAMEQGLWPLAEEVFTDIVAKTPDLPEGWNKRATVRYLAGDIEGSVRDIHETLKREPRHFGALSGLGLIYLDRGQDDAALRAFARVLDVYPQMPSARAHVRALRDKLKGSEI